MTSDNNKEIDKHSGIETTGHEWDGIKELNNPAPRWWLIIFIITFIWGVGYWVIYPSWPTFSNENERGGTKGNIGWTQYNQLKEQQADILARKANYLKRFANSSLDEIMHDAELYAFALAGGKSSFKDNCATCHGTGGAGAKGYPNLNDDDWLWGGDLDSIYTSIKYGIRSKHEETKFSEMPAFASILSDKDIDDVSQYVLSLSDNTALTETGAVLYKDNCTSCHGTRGKGSKEIGAPNLSDSIWFYSNGDKSSIAAQIKYPKHGVMPNWSERLDDETIRQISIYVHSLGGGE